MVYREMGMFLSLLQRRGCTECFWNTPANGILLKNLYTPVRALR